MTLADKITDFLESKVHYEYVNRHGVKFEAEDDLAFGASYTLMESESEKRKEYWLNVEYRGSKDDFLKTLEIKSPVDLNKITPEKLMALFERGVSQLVCYVTVAYLYCMTFERWGDKTIAKSENNCLHQFDEPIDSQEGYINYTQRYYTLIKSYSIN